MRHDNSLISIRQAESYVKSMLSSLRCVPSRKPIDLASCNQLQDQTPLPLDLCIAPIFQPDRWLHLSFRGHDPTDLGATTELLFQALYLSIFNLTPTHKTCPFTYGNKASIMMSVILSSIVSLSATSLTGFYRMLRKNLSKA